MKLHQYSYKEWAVAIMVFLLVAIPLSFIFMYSLMSCGFAGEHCIDFLRPAQSVHIGNEWVPFLYNMSVMFVRQVCIATAVILGLLQMARGKVHSPLAYLCGFLLAVLGVVYGIANTYVYYVVMQMISS